jgi:hypothetical protein
LTDATVKRAYRPSGRVAAGLGRSLAEECVVVENDAPRVAVCERLLKASLADARAIRNYWTAESEPNVVEGIVDDAGAGAVVVTAVFHPVPAGHHADDR